MQTLEELKRRQTKRVVSFLHADGCLPECDEKINALSRAIIRAMKREHGAVWLGKFNARTFPYLWEYQRGMAYNFAAAFALPNYDEELAALLMQHSHLEDFEASSRRLKDAFARIEEIGGVYLHWT